MEPLAVEWGVPANEYWSMTYAEIVTQVEANKKRYELEMKNKAMFDYNSAQLNAYAFNDPSKMPKVEEVFPFLKKEKESSQPQQGTTNEDYNMEKDKAILLSNLQAITNHLKKGGGTNDD